MNALILGLMLATTVHMNGVMVVPIEYQYDNIDTTVLDELIVQELSTRWKGSVVGYSDIDSILEFESGRDSIGCDDWEIAECSEELADALGVSKIVSGTIGRLGGNAWLFLKLINTEDMSIVRSSVNMSTASIDYHKAVVKAVSDLVGLENKLTVKETRYKNGRLKTKCSFHKDTRHGPCVGWYPDGALYFEYKYDRGKLVSKKQWNKKKTPIPKDQSVREFLETHTPPDWSG